MAELTRQVLADLLFEHERKTGIRDGRPHCKCGWSGRFNDQSATDFRAHLVEVIYQEAHSGQADQ